MKIYVFDLNLFCSHYKTTQLKSDTSILWKLWREHNEYYNMQGGFMLICDRWRHCFKAKKLHSILKYFHRINFKNRGPCTLFSLLTLFQSDNLLISYKLAMTWSICFVSPSKIQICSGNRHDEEILICSWRYSSFALSFPFMHNACPSRETDLIFYSKSKRFHTNKNWALIQWLLPTGHVHRRDSIQDTDYIANPFLNFKGF